MTTSAIRTILTKNIKQQLEEEARFGILLSGGVDSSLLTALVCQEMPEVKTFSVGFEEDEYDETEYILQTSNKLGTKHNHLMVRERDFAGHLPELIRLYGHPLSSPSMVPTYMLYKHAKNEVNRLVTGEGADGMFAGSGNFTFTRISSLPRSAKLLANFLLSACPTFLLPKVGHERKKKLQRILSLSSEEYLSFANCYSGLHDVMGLLSRNAGRDPLKYRRLFLYSGCSSFEQLYELGIHTNIPNEPNFMNSLAHHAGVVLCFPFLNKDLLDLASELPANFLHRYGTGKYVLKKLAESYFSTKFIYKPKGGFGVPLEYWFKNNALLA